MFLESYSCVGTSPGRVISLVDLVEARGEVRLG